MPLDEARYRGVSWRCRQRWPEPGRRGETIAKRREVPRPRLSGAANDGFQRPVTTRKDLEREMPAAFLRSNRRLVRHRAFPTEPPFQREAPSDRPSRHIEAPVLPRHPAPEQSASPRFPRAVEISAGSLRKKGTRRHRRGQRRGPQPSIFRSDRCHDRPKCMERSCSWTSRGQFPPKNFRQFALAFRMLPGMSRLHFSDAVLLQFK